VSPENFLWIFLGYFGLLLFISWYTSRNANSASYFLGNKQSPWYAVALGMIGDSLSGVTYISVPGAVEGGQFSYFQLVLGYFFGYMVITNVLLPLYYKMNLTSIYSYLESRFGTVSQRTGSFFFILSRLLGAGGRLYLAAGVLQIFVFNELGVPFGLSVSVIIALMLIYTYRGGIKTLVWTDMFQSGFLILGVVLSIVAILSQLNWGWSDVVNAFGESKHTQIFFWDVNAKSFFFKQFFGGMFIAIVMTGLDQNMMQKNLSLRTLKDAQKNIRWFSIVLIAVNFLFLSLGALLYLFAQNKGIALEMKEGKVITDAVFPSLALNHLGTFASIVFILGLIASTFSSADSVLTSLTTSFMIDFKVGIKKKLNAANDSNILDDHQEKENTKIRHIIHIGFAVLLLIVILIFKAMNNDAIINTILSIATYTYGPLLGLFAFGIFTKWEVRDKLTPIICIISPLICYFLSLNSKVWFSGYEFGHEILILNGLFTFGGLMLIRRKSLISS